MTIMSENILIWVLVNSIILFAFVPLNRIPGLCFVFHVFLFDLVVSKLAYLNVVSYI